MQHGAGGDESFENQPLQRQSKIQLMKTVKTVKTAKAMKTVTAMKAMKQQHSSFYEPLQLQNSKPQHPRKKPQVCCPLS
jgi:hypothetical protein